MVSRDIWERNFAGMVSSSIYMMVWPSEITDELLFTEPQPALQFGTALLRGMPIVIAVELDRALPAAVRRAAEHIIAYSSPEDLSQQLAAYLGKPNFTAKLNEFDDG